MRRYEITEEKIYRMAKQMNRKYFNNELDIDKIKFKVSSATRFLGHWSYRGDCVVIKISKYLVVKAKAKNTMVHELIHHWQWVNFKQADHGFTFHKKAAEIRKFDPDMIIKSQSNLEKDGYTAAADSIKKAVEKRNLNKVQYLIKRNLGGQPKYNFLKNLKHRDIIRLKAISGAKIYRMDNFCTSVKNCRNVDAFLTSRYYYNQLVIDRIMKNTKLQEVKL